MNDRPIHHVCYIVDDIPKAVDQWVEAIGAGPFFHLIELHEVTPELESRFYSGAAGGSNIAHIGYVVDDPAAESARLHAAGMPKFLHLRQGPIQISLHDAPVVRACDRGARAHRRDPRAVRAVRGWG
jgi:catechol 2,3-dioxygenase-like lactoylglutathione lyase family enzyme